MTMALRIRQDGRVLCAALHGSEPGDAYLDDGTHYELSVVRRVLVTEPMPKHAERGEWWWKGQEPADVEIDPFYYEEPARSSGVAMIAAERRRQIDEEGWTPDHDDSHANGELALAGACYAIPADYDTAEAIEFPTQSSLDGHQMPALWPWQHRWYKRVRGDRSRELAKAGALIAAELDRLLRGGVSDG